MRRIMTGLLVVLGMSMPSWGQDVEKKPAPKAEGAKEGGDKGPGPQLLVSEVDTNADGWISAAELKAALSKLGGGGPKEGGKKPGGPRDGEGKKPEGPKDGEGKKPEGPRDGDLKKPAPKGDAPRKDAPKEGDREKGEK